MHQIGDPLPSVDLQEGSPKTKVNVKDLFAGKKGVLFAVPGAFTPGCSNVSIKSSCETVLFIYSKSTNISVVILVIELLIFCVHVIICLIPWLSTIKIKLVICESSGFPCSVHRIQYSLVSYRDPRTKKSRKGLDKCA